jgi:hypothetical protein
MLQKGVDEGVDTIMDALVDAVRELGEDTAIKYVRLIGMLVCPDAGAHPAVVRYCIWSLISGPFKEQVAEDLRSWIGAQYLRLQPAA